MRESCPESRPSQEKCYHARTDPIDDGFEVRPPHQTPSDPGAGGDVIAPANARVARNAITELLRPPHHMPTRRTGRKVPLLTAGFVVPVSF